VIALFPGRHRLRYAENLEVVIETIELMPEPFTIQDVWHASGTYYSIAETVVRELRSYGLVVKVEPDELVKPHRYTRVQVAA